MSKPKKTSLTAPTPASPPLANHPLSRRYFLITQGVGAAALVALLARPARGAGENGLAADNTALGCDISQNVFGIHNAKCFGATGDGVTDDTAAIRAALNAGPYVLLPAGTYLTTAPLELRDNQVLTGAGRDLSVIRNTTTDGIRKNPSAATLNCASVANLTVESGPIGGPTNRSFNLTAWNNCRLTNVQAKYAKVGFYLSRGAKTLGYPGCFFNALENIRAFGCARGVRLMDNGANVNACFFKEVVCEDTTA